MVSPLNEFIVPGGISNNKQVLFKLRHRYVNTSWQFQLRSRFSWYLDRKKTNSLRASDYSVLLTCHYEFIVGCIIGKINTNRIELKAMIYLQSAFGNVAEFCFRWIINIYPKRFTRRSFCANISWYIYRKPIFEIAS